MGAISLYLDDSLGDHNADPAKIAQKDQIHRLSHHMLLARIGVWNVEQALAIMPSPTART